VNGKGEKLIAIEAVIDNQLAIKAIWAIKNSAFSLLVNTSIVLHFQYPVV
jgi:hypothetical protein